jgi:hypothetical protein
MCPCMSPRALTIARSRRRVGACRLSTICFALRRSIDLRSLLLIEVEYALCSTPSPNYGRSHSGLVGGGSAWSRHATLPQLAGSLGATTRDSWSPLKRPALLFPTFTAFQHLFAFAPLLLLFLSARTCGHFFHIFRLCSASLLRASLFFFFFFSFEPTSSNLQCVFFLSPRALHSPMWWSRNRSLIL